MVVASEGVCGSFTAACGGCNQIWRECERLSAIIGLSFFPLCLRRADSNLECAKEYLEQETFRGIPVFASRLGRHSGGMSRSDGVIAAGSRLVVA